MAATFKGVVQLTEAQYNTLKTNGTITVGDVTLTYDQNTLYATTDSTIALSECTSDSTHRVVTDTQISTWTNDKMDKVNPTGTGALSLNRKANTTIGTNSVAEGYNGTASANYSHSEGYSTTASGTYSHAEGDRSTASGNSGAHAEGSQNTASGNSSHSEGVANSSTGYAAHAEGSTNGAYGDYSHAEGGMSCLAYSTSSHAEGDHASAIGYASHAEGYYTGARGNYQHVGGSYNILDPTGPADATVTPTKGTYIEIIGNGTANNARSNARTLDWSGNEWLAGKLTPAGGLSDGNNTNYKLLLPNTTNWTANKTIATTDQLDYNVNFSKRYIKYKRCVPNSSNVVTFAYQVSKSRTSGDSYFYIDWGDGTIERKTVSSTTLTPSGAFVTWSSGNNEYVLNSYYSFSHTYNSMYKQYSQDYDAYYNYPTITICTEADVLLHICCTNSFDTLVVDNDKAVPYQVGDFPYPTSVDIISCANIDLETNSGVKFIKVGKIDGSFGANNTFGFYYMANLEKIEFTKGCRMNFTQENFEELPSLKEIDLSNCTLCNLGDLGFSSFLDLSNGSTLTALERIVLPANFEDNYGMEDMTISSQNLKSIVLLFNSVPALDDSNYSNTIPSGCYIYVKPEMVSAFKSDSSWISTGLADKVKSLGEEFLGTISGSVIRRWS